MNRRHLLAGIAALLLTGCVEEGTITYVYCSKHRGVDHAVNGGFGAIDAIQCKDGTFAPWYGATTYGPKSEDGWVIYVQ